MRHAKSDWEHNLPDIERPLNKRGKKAAAKMGEELLKRNIAPDIILSSPANRARTTAELVIEAIGYEKELLIVKDFYFGYTDSILDKVKTIEKVNSTVLIIGHNPIWEDLLMGLSKDNQYVTMPTAALACLSFDIDDWSGIELKSGKQEWLITPKTI